MKSIFALCLVVLTHVSCANDITWHEGTIVLADNRSVMGNLAIEMQHDVVLLKRHDQVEVFPAHKVLSVFFFDVSAKIDRKFIVIQQSSLSFKIFRIFEVVLHGELSLIRRSNPEYYNDISSMPMFQYYVKTEEALVPLRKFQSKIYPKINESNVAAEYVKRNKLNARNTHHALKMLEFYNRVCYQNSKEASVLAMF